MSVPPTGMSELSAGTINAKIALIDATQRPQKVVLNVSEKSRGCLRAAECLSKFDGYFGGRC
jgi:hypothetical protein